MIQTWNKYITMFLMPFHETVEHLYVMNVADKAWVSAEDSCEMFKFWRYDKCHDAKN